MKNISSSIYQQFFFPQYTCYVWRSVWVTLKKIKVWCSTSIVILTKAWRIGPCLLLLEKNHLTHIPHQTIFSLGSKVCITEVFIILSYFSPSSPPFLLSLYPPFLLPSLPFSLLSSSEVIYNLISIHHTYAGKSMKVKSHICNLILRKFLRQRLRG